MDTLFQLINLFTRLAYYDQEHWKTPQVALLREATASSGLLREATTSSGLLRDVTTSGGMLIELYLEN